MANAGFPYNPFIMSSIRCVAASQKAGSRGCQVAANARLRASQVWTSQTRWTGQVQPARWESSWFVSWTGNQGNQGNQGIQGIQENQGNQKNQGNPGNQGKGSKGTQQTREPRREPREPSWRDGHFFRVNDHEWIISPPAIWRSNWWPTGRTPGVGKKTTSWETSTDLQASQESQVSQERFTSCSDKNGTLESPLEGAPGWKSYPPIPGRLEGPRFLFF